MPPSIDLVFSSTTRNLFPPGSSITRDEHFYFGGVPPPLIFLIGLGCYAPCHLKSLILLQLLSYPPPLLPHLPVLPFPMFTSPPLPTQINSQIQCPIYPPTQPHPYFCVWGPRTNGCSCPPSQHLTNNPEAPIIFKKCTEWLHCPPCVILLFLC